MFRVCRCGKPITCKWGKVCVRCRTAAHKPRLCECGHRIETSARLCDKCKQTKEQNAASAKAGRLAQWKRTLESYRTKGRDTADTIRVSLANGLTLREIGKELHISGQRCHQLIKKYPPHSQSEPDDGIQYDGLRNFDPS